MNATEDDLTTEARINSGMTALEIANEVIRVTGYTEDLADVVELLLSRMSRVVGSRDDAKDRLGRFARIASAAGEQLERLQLAARDQAGLGWGTIAAAVGVSRSTIRGQIQSTRRDYAAQGRWFDSRGEHQGTADETASALRQALEGDTEMEDKDTVLASVNRQAQLRKLTKAKLIRMYKDGIAAPDGRKVYYGGGAYPIEQWSKDDIIASIVSIEYPQ